MNELIGSLIAISILLFTGSYGTYLFIAHRYDLVRKKSNVVDMTSSKKICEDLIDSFDKYGLPIIKDSTRYPMPEVKEPKEEYGVDYYYLRKTNKISVVDITGTKGYQPISENRKPIPPGPE